MVILPLVSVDSGSPCYDFVRAERLFRQSNSKSNVHSELLGVNLRV